jgi:triphosphoribosyl-dephospho-CoA synthetase
MGSFGPALARSPEEALVVEVQGSPQPAGVDTDDHDE